MRVFRQPKEYGWIAVQNSKNRLLTRATQIQPLAFTDSCRANERKRVISRTILHRKVTSVKQVRYPSLRDG